MSRVAVNDYTFSDGTTVPRGTTVAVSVHKAQFDDQVYEDPLKFDGFRFSRMSQEGSGKIVGMVTSNLNHLSFGHGRHICPGRHFASCEVKLMLAHIVVTYDVKVEIEGVRPPDMWVTTSCVPNPNAHVLFRKRTNALGVLWRWKRLRHGWFWALGSFHIQWNILSQVCEDRLAYSKMRESIVLKCKNSMTSPSEFYII